MSKFVKSTILVAATDAVVRERLAWALLARGYRVMVARDGFETIDVALSGDVDLIVLDLNLPWVDGEMLRRHMAGDPELRRILVIPMGTADQLRDETQALLTPVREEALAQAVAAAIGPPQRRRLTSSSLIDNRDDPDSGPASG